jgi:secreted Zn-dependent insulinase-like peptidase
MKEHKIVKPTEFKLITASTDKKKYKLLTLENQMKVLLIETPYEDRSAVSLDLNVGSALD